MVTMKFCNTLKSQFDTFVNTSFNRSFLVYVVTLVINILRFITGYLYRLKPGGTIEEKGLNLSIDHCRNDDRVVCKNSTVFLSSGVDEKESLELQKGKDCNRSVADAGDSVFLIAKTSKYQYMFGKDVIEYVEEPNTSNLMVHEMFVGSDEDSVSVDRSLDDEISPIKHSLEHKMERSLSLQECDEQSEPPSFVFRFLPDSYYSTNEHVEEHVSEVENIDQDKGEDSFESTCTEFRQENEESDSASSKDCRVEDEDFENDESMEDQEFSYEVELLPEIQHSFTDAKQESANNGNEVAFTEHIDLLEATNQKKTGVFVEEDNIDQVRLFISSPVLRIDDIEYLDDEFLEFEPLRVNSTDTGKNRFSNGDVGKSDETTTDETLHSEKMSSVESLHENKNFWDSDSDDEDETDALSEHQNLVQQMKMELKNCRNGGLPTISEECETFKMADDLKPLNIDKKFEYKDVMEEIQKFYKSYAEKMRKLDILNYQTLQAISFLQLKDSEVFTAGKKKSASIPSNLQKIWPYKVKRIFDDPMQKSIMEMNRDLDLVYVGQLCLSWEILCWLYAKALELIEYDSKGNHSYNRVAEEFQQFQVLLQRFMEDEPFQGPRIQNYVKSRCLIRSLLQVPTIKDDCLKDKKERSDGTDAISLQSLTEIISESMLIFKEFLRTDKSTANVILKGVHGTKVYHQETANPELLMDIITTLQKKDRRIREQMRSQNCIVKKLQKHQECHRRLDEELLTSQVELSLVSRVLSLSRLTTDQLVWCQNKLSNISIVKSVVHVEPSLLLFPC